jgi:hypothetical protein
MSTPPGGRRTGTVPDPPPDNELTVFLWVVVGLLAVLELSWAFFSRMYAA